MEDENKTVTLLAGGDVGRLDLNPDAKDELADLVLPLLRQADLRFAQCESTYSDRALSSQNSARQQPTIWNAGGRSNAHPRQAAVWDTAGIDVISMASNNTMKEGPEVLLETIDLFRRMGKHVIGAGADIEAARRPAILERKGVKIAFLAYCSVLQEHHEARRGKAGCAPMRAHTYYRRRGNAVEDSQPGTPPHILSVPYDEDLRALQADISAAKGHADAVVVSLHWGIHHIPKAIADYQPVVAHAAIEAGADLILGHHPHCMKAVEVYKGKVCFYGLGNFMMTSHRAHAAPEYWHRWNLWWYQLDPAYTAPDALYHFPPHCRKTMIAKAIFGKSGIERVSFFPAFINPRAQPEPLMREDPRFNQVLDYMEWLSDHHPHKFDVVGNEIVINANG